MRPNRVQWGQIEPNGLNGAKKGQAEPNRAKWDQIGPKFWVPEHFGKKKICPKTIWGKKNVGYKTIFVKKNLGSKKILIKKNLEY